MGMSLIDNKGKENPETDVNIFHLHPGRLAITSKKIFLEPEKEACVQFIQALFQVQEVRQILVNPSRCRAIVHYDIKKSEAAFVLKKISDTLQAHPKNPSHQYNLFLRKFGIHPVRVVRYGKTLSTWELVHHVPQRVRLRHHVLQYVKGMSDRIEEGLTGIQGINEVRSDIVTASILVKFDESFISLQNLLIWLEEFLVVSSVENDEKYQPDYALTIKTASMVVATLAQFAFPALKPVSATLLVASNIDTYAKAFNQLYERKVDRETLETILTILALQAESYFSGSLMIWLQEIWPELFAKILRRYAKKLLIAPRQRSMTTYILSKNNIKKALITAIDSDSIISVKAGMTVPVDGRVLDGKALVDESAIFGSMEPVKKNRRSLVYASSVVVEGQLFIKMTHQKQETTASKISAIVVQAAGAELREASEAPFFIQKIAPAILVAGGIGFILGGPAAAQAIMRPDYLTGPTLAPSVSLLRTLTGLTRRGIIVRNAVVLEKIANLDTIILSGDSGIDVEQVYQSLRACSVSDIILATEKGNNFTVSVSDEPEEKIHRINADLSTRIKLIASLQEQGKKVAYVSGRISDRDVFKQADVAICLDGLSSLDYDAADILFMRPTPDHFTRLFDEVKAHRGRIADSYRYTVIPNFCGVAGTLLAEFPPLFNVILSNLGILMIYETGLHGLRQLDPHAGMT